MKRITLLLTVVILSATGLLAACNTVQGAGEDIQAGGHAIAKAANSSKPS